MSVQLPVKAIPEMTYTVGWDVKLCTLTPPPTVPCEM